MLCSYVHPPDIPEMLNDLYVALRVYTENHEAKTILVHLAVSVKEIFKWNPLTKISQGRPKYRWEDKVKQDICQMKVKNCITCVQDRGKWKDVVDKAVTFNQ
jgi:hypothetical protein